MGGDAVRTERVKEVEVDSLHARAGSSQLPGRTEGREVDGAMTHALESVATSETSESPASKPVGTPAKVRLSGLKASQRGRPVAENERDEGESNVLWRRVKLKG